MCRKVWGFKSPSAHHVFIVSSMSSNQPTLEDRLNRVLDAARMGIWDWDMSRGTIVCNKYHAVIWGFPPDKSEVTVEELGSRIHPDDRESINARYAAAIRDRTDFEGEYRILWPDGSVHWNYGRGRIFYDDDGKPVRATGSVMNVTAQKQAEADADYERRRLHDLFMQAPALVMILRGPDLIIELANSASRQFMADPNPVGKRRGDVNPGRHPDLKAAELLGRVYATGETLNKAELPVRLTSEGGKADEMRYFDVAAQSTRDLQGGIDGVMLFALDVTGKVLARHECEENEERLRQIFEAIPQMVWTSMPDGTVDSANRKFLDYFGITLEQAGANEWKRGIHPDDLELLLGRWANALKTGEQYEIECRMKRDSDRKYRWHLNRALPLRDTHGRIVKWFGTCTDIEDQKRQSEELARSNAELQRFAYVASHDLKEPLRMVSLYMDLLGARYKGKLSEEADEFIRFAVDGALRMRALIDDILSFSRVGRSGEPEVSVDCAAIVATVIESLKPAIDESRAEIELGALPTLFGSQFEIEQLFQNLIGNAVKFRRPGVAPRVKIFAEQKRAAWVVSVQDNGIGIAQQYFPLIFGMFERLHGRHEYPGTGLGLAICKKIAETHGGRIWVESEEGHGSTFHFSWPI